jgi:hypothetical protein
MPKQTQQPPFPTLNYKNPDLSTLYHDDRCCYHDDTEFCSCGADTYEELKAYKAAYKELETALQKQQEELAQLQKTTRNINKHLRKYLNK